MPALVRSLVTWALLLNGRSADPDDVRLVAAAAASPRPVVCDRANDSFEGRTPIWRRATEPWLSEACTTLALGYARLLEKPAEALELSERVQKLAPSMIEAEVLQGRALLALARAREAWASLERCLARDGASLRSPAALRDYALAGVRTNHLDEALRAYRELVSRTELLSAPEEGARIRIEAGLVAMRAPKGSLEEALDYLSAVREEVTPLREWALGFQALLLDRQGRGEQALGILLELELPSELNRFANRSEEQVAAGGAHLILGAPFPVAYRPDVHALLGLWLERDDPSRAREQWAHYLESVGGSDRFRPHAQAKLQALQRRGRR